MKPMTVNTVHRTFGRWLADPKTGDFDAASIRVLDPVFYPRIVAVRLTIGVHHAEVHFTAEEIEIGGPDLVASMLDSAAKKVRDRADVVPGVGAAWGSMAHEMEANR